MSTRALYGFKDRIVTFWVFVHHDGYPEGAASKFKHTLESGKVWPLPRFEANEFAAGFVTANKLAEGDVRLSHGPTTHGDIEYVYIVRQEEKVLRIQAFNNGNSTDMADMFYSGTLDGFIKEEG